jgi:hypothetical protein
MKKARNNLKNEPGIYKAPRETMELFCLIIFYKILLQINRLIVFLGMLKRTGASLLALLYMVTVIGFALNFHYCFGYLSSVKINEPVKSRNFTATAKMKCCKDKHFEIKVKDAHQAEAQSFLAKVFAFESPALAFAEFSFSTQQHY